MSGDPFDPAAQMVREMHKEALVDPGTCLRCRQPWPCPPVADLNVQQGRCACGSGPATTKAPYVNSSDRLWHTPHGCRPAPGTGPQQ